MYLEMTSSSNHLSNLSATVFCSTAIRLPVATTHVQPTDWYPPARIYGRRALASHLFHILLAISKTSPSRLITYETQHYMLDTALYARHSIIC